MAKVRSSFIAGIAVFVTAMSLVSVVFAGWKTFDYAIGQSSLTRGGRLGADGTKLPNTWGVYKDINGKLFICDSTFSRVLIYNSIPTSNQQEPNVVVGQPSLTAGDYNNPNFGAASASNLYGPTAVYSDGTKLFIADSNNNRVLIYNSIPTTSGASADIVVGQADMTTRAGGTTASTLSYPSGVYYDGTKLYICDQGNHRVLIYNTLPASNGASANIAIGQANLTSGGVNRGGTTASNSLSNPQSVWVSGGKIFIPDFSNNRVLIYNSVPANQAAADLGADVVVGQADLTSAGFGGPNANTVAQPRAVGVSGTKLAVVCSPYNHNRVSIFNTIPTSNNAAADIVAGQPDKTTGSAGTTASKFSSPFGVAIDATNLIVSDYGNNRVLVYNTVPTSDGASANIVLGQSNMTTGNSSVAANTLSRPIAVYSDGNKVYVTDRNDQRVLVFNAPISSNNASADVVIGQTDMISGGYATTASNFLSPAQVFVIGTKLLAADTGNNRVLIFNTIPSSNGASADVVIGQANMTSGSANQGGAVGANTLYNPVSMWSDATKLIICDSQNSRVLIYNTFPTSNNASADVVIGQANMTSGSANQGGSVGANTLQGPQKIFVYNGKLVIADTYNNRVLVYNTIPTTNNANADVVIGQQNMTSNSANQGGTTAANTMGTSIAIHVDNDGRLYILDWQNTRVLVYKSIPTTNNASADFVMGQSSFTTSTQNDYAFPTASSLRLQSGGGSDLCVKDKTIYIVDEANHRIAVGNWSVPASSQNLKITVKEKKVTLTWDASTSAESTITGYNVYRKIGTGTYQKLNTTTLITTTYTDTIEKGKTYNYYVTAIDFLDFEGTTSKAVSLASAGMTLEPGQAGELTATNDPYTKLIIPADTIKRKLQYTLEAVFELPNSSKLEQQVVIAYDIEAKDANTGEVVKVLDGGVTVVIHWIIAAGYISGTTISSQNIAGRIGVGYWNSRYWQPLTSRVDVSGNDLFVTAKVTHLSMYGMILKEKTVSFSATPNPFTPLGPDPQFRQVNFTFENTNGEDVELKIWDITGRLVRTITAYGVSTISWDGRNEYGEVCEGGVYIYQLKVGNSLVGRGTVVLAK